MHARSRARWEVLATAALFSTGGAAIKACSFSGPQVAGLRTAIAALTLLAIVPAARRIPRWREWLVGVAYAGSLVLYTLANKRTTAASAIFLQSSAPLYILFLAPWLLAERIKRIDLAFLAVAAIGLSFFFLESDAPQGSAPEPVLGNALALGSGLAWALTLVGLRWLGTRGENVSAVIAGNCIAFLACLPWTLTIRSAGTPDVAVVLWMGVFQVGTAYALLTRALRHLPAFEAAVLLLVEPLLNPVWAWIFQGERPGPWSLAGGALLIGATIWKSRLDARPEPLSSPTSSTLPTPAAAAAIDPPSATAPKAPGRS